MHVLNRTHKLEEDFSAVYLSSKTSIWSKLQKLLEALSFDIFHYQIQLNRKRLKVIQRTYLSLGINCIVKSYNILVMHLFKKLYLLDDTSFALIIG